VSEGTLPRNTRQTRRQLRKLRDGIDQSQVAGYKDAGGVPRPFRGDDDAPWGKHPPFPSEATAWQALLTLPADQACALLSPLDVAYYRVLAAFFQYTPADPQTGQLSIVPEVWNETQESWYATAVVDPTLTAPVDACALPGYGSRTFYGTELRTPVGLPVSIAVPFDVTAYTRFRLRLRDLSPEGEGNDPGTVRVYYALSL
jgi:hypothetical protein